MVSTPILEPFRTNSGTFYTFTSAINHLNMMLNTDQLRVGFSKYALLNLPEVRFQSVENRMNFIFPEMLLGRREADQPIIDYLEANRQDELVASLQNFAFEFETLLMKNPSYVQDLAAGSIAERVFFKWLSEQGAIRFRPNSEGAIFTNFTNNVENRRWSEEEARNTSQEAYQPVVVHIGDISIVNNVQEHGQSVGEIYIQIPTNEGNTPNVLFKSRSDANYRPGLNLQAGDYIEGSTDEFSDETDLPTVPFYNNQSAGNNVFSTQLSGNYNRWDENLIEVVSAETFDPLYAYDIWKNVIDGITIDWTEENYKMIQDNNWENFSDLNSSQYSDHFKFNAALVYYDVYQKTDEDRWETISTNLYGIQFLSPQTLQGTGSAVQLSFPHFQKFKTYENDENVTGNSYGFRINSYLSNSVRNLTEVQPINDYNLRSLELFAMISNQLIENTNKIQQLKVIENEILEKISVYDDILLGSGQLSLESLNNRLQALENRFGISTPIFEISTPQEVWIIEHNLGLFPSVTVTDMKGNVVYPAITYLNDYKIEVSFSRPSTGKVFLNVIQTGILVQDQQTVDDLLKIKLSLEEIKQILEGLSESPESPDSPESPEGLSAPTNFEAISV